MEAGIQSTFLENLKDFVLVWKIPTSSPKARLLWILILPSIYWTIWLEKNQRSFENYAEPSFKVFARAKDRCCFWASYCKKWERLTFVELKHGWGQLIKDS